MNQVPSESPSAPLPPPTLPRPDPGGHTAHPSAARASGQWVLLLALVVALAALALSGMLWQKLDFTQQELARRSQESGATAVEARTLATQAEALTQELQARLSVAEVRLSEVSLQRSQLDELMLTLSRSRDDNLVQDLEAALRLAQQQTQLTGSAQPLISALQAVDQRIGRAAQPRLNPVQRAITRDIERIQAASLADIPALVLRLDEVARQVDEWPLLNQVGQRAVAAPTKSALPAVDTADQKVDSQPPEANPGARGLGEGWARVADWWTGLWSTIWTDVTRSGRELVRVSRIDQPEAVLLAPEQAFFIRENLKLKLLNARLGLLARHMASSQADLIAVEAAIAKYFDTSSPLVRGAQVAVSQVRKDIVDGVLPRPDETLAALSAAAGGR
ncbi:uroporphyrin-3 C-methyltransferase [Hydrogenophaga palleronii]|uniref:Uroporphyrin-3 C-methyltransferase n=1 Tax=Hydrogenophaga palleronii TaxID=65655 RepID=A0ABU1WPS8_9BURK|nr:uroporphyrinogen-III C-methyltransferase [Hydrogenophaga palleronii]MDR7151288.1 uroporphyrin-3 C-methyltransferase [Hydrogenophaga palleronii]